MLYWEDIGILVYFYGILFTITEVPLKFQLIPKTLLHVVLGRHWNFSLFLWNIIHHN
uniref:Uncharacterized protein n=1 Tax=Rhizophora mucronata TaxID=61149 RepID=A0A2P2Q6H0_RHIMU